MARDGRPPSFDEFDARLERLRGERSASATRGKSRSGRQSKVGAGLQAGIELAVGVVGGALIGHALDVWLGTRWVFLVVLFFLGAVAGMLNAYRLLRRLGVDDPEGPDGGA